MATDSITPPRAGEVVSSFLLHSLERKKSTMNAHWVKLVSVAALALAGTLAVACSSDDDDDDNDSTQGSAGTGGKAGSGGGSGAGGGSGTGGGSGSAGASGAGGGGMIVLPPTDKAGLQAALLNEGKGAPKYSPTVAAAKWACSDPDDNATDVELKTTTSKFHNETGTEGDESPARYCSNYNLSQVTYDQTDGWPLGAASMKETLDEDGKIIEWSYYALKGDGTSWYGARIVPTGDGGDVVPVERDALIPADVTLEFTEGGCTGSSCHADPGNTNVLEWVIRGDAVPHDNPMWLAPNPYKQ